MDCMMGWGQRQALRICKFCVAGESEKSMWQCIPCPLC